MNRQAGTLKMWFPNKAPFQLPLSYEACNNHCQKYTECHGQLVISLQRTAQAAHLTDHDREKSFFFS